MRTWYNSVMSGYKKEVVLKNITLLIKIFNK